MKNLMPYNNPETGKEVTNFGDYLREIPSTIENEDESMLELSRRFHNDPMGELKKHLIRYKGEYFDD